MVEKIKRANNHAKYFRGGGNICILIFKNYKVSVPTIIRKYVVNWYHTYLLNPGMERKEATIGQHYYWPNLRDDIHTHINVCNNCQKNKNKTKGMKNSLIRKRSPFHGTDYW